MMVKGAKDYKLAQHRILHFSTIPLNYVYFNNESEWPQLLKIALKSTLMVPKFTITNLLVWILLLLETLVFRVALGIHSESDCHNCGQFKSLQISVLKLENVVKELTERLYETERRLLSVEECDCFRSCNINGTLHPEGSSWKQNCDICSCVRGEVTCRPIHCSIPCKHPELDPNACCPVCKKTCYLNGQVLQHGERIKISTKKVNSGRCGECVCNDGKTSCKQIDVEKMCPKLDCPIEDQFSKEGECCKFCAGTDFCSNGNECHPNATCHNLKAQYVCSCNKGFKGDGKLCQDINECDHKGGNYGHHCGQNTECVNLSGSYKCECLDGFTRLDKYKCIDIDECSTGRHTCHSSANCINEDGGYYCDCKSTDNTNKSCSMNCMFNNYEYIDGETWTPIDDNCTKCLCKKGFVSCQQTCNSADSTEAQNQF